MIELLIGLAVSTLVSGTVLWLAMKMTGVDGTYAGMLTIAFAAAVVGMIPMLGWILSLVVMFALIVSFTTAEFFPDAVLMVVVAWGLKVVLSLVILGTLLNFSG